MTIPAVISPKAIIWERDLTVFGRIRHILLVQESRWCGYLEVIQAYILREFHQPSPNAIIVRVDKSCEIMFTF